MSKERARRRAERLAVQEKERGRRERRQRRRAVLRKLRPRPRRRGVGRLARYSRGQRLGIAVIPLVAVAAIWFLVPDLALRLVLVLMIVLVLPPVVVVVLGRRS